MLAIHWIEITVNGHRDLFTPSLNREFKCYIRREEYVWRRGLSRGSGARSLAWTVGVLFVSSASHARKLTVPRTSWSSHCELHCYLSLSVVIFSDLLHSIEFFAAVLDENSSPKLLNYNSNAESGLWNWHSAKKLVLRIKQSSTNCIYTCDPLLFYVWWIFIN